MTKFSYLYLLMALSCAFVHAADDGSAAFLAGTKRRTSDPDATAISAASGRAVAPTHPTTPTRPKPPVQLEMWSQGRGFHTSPVKDVPTPAREFLSGGIGDPSALQKARIVLDEAKTYSSPQRKAVAYYAGGLLDDYLARQSSVTAGGSGDVLADVLQGHHDLAQSDNSSEMAGYRRDIEGLNPESLTAGLNVRHVKSPFVFSSGMIFGGHVLPDYASASGCKVEDTLVFPGGRAGMAKIKATVVTPGKKTQSKKNCKTVFMEPLTEAEIASLSHKAKVVGVSEYADKKLIHSSDRAFISYSKAGVHSDTCTYFPALEIEINAFDLPEIPLGELQSSGAKITIAPKDLKSIVSEHLIDSEKRKKLTLLFNKQGQAFAVAGNLGSSDIVPMGAVVHLTEDLKSLVGQTTPVAFDSAAWRSPARTKPLSGTSSSSRAVSPISMSSFGSSASGSGSSSSSPVEMH
jgi:hypothetical protein